LKFEEVSLSADLTAEEKEFAATMTDMIRERTSAYPDQVKKLPKVVE
jgi:hypothetical protein